MLKNVPNDAVKYENDRYNIALMYLNDRYNVAVIVFKMHM